MPMKLFPDSWDRFLKTVYVHRVFLSLLSRYRLVQLALLLKNLPMRSNRPQLGSFPGRVVQIDDFSGLN
jgi:hypothetical protein